MNYSAHTYFSKEKSFLFLLMALLLVISSCGQNKENNEKGITYQTNEKQASDDEASVVYLSEEEYKTELTSKDQPKSQNKDLGYKYYSVMSQDFGIPVGAMIIPNSWYESNNVTEGLLFEGPNEIKIYKEQFASHFYSNDYSLNQIHQQGGKSVQAPKSLEDFINQDLTQIMKTEGFQLTSMTPLPVLAELETKFDSYLFKATPSEKQFQCMITEWEDQKGNPAMVIIRYFHNYYQIGGMDWGYTANAMSSNKNVYEKTKNAYIYSLVNFWINPQWVEANNQHWRQVAQQSNAGHQQRMAAIKAQGQAIIQQGKMHSDMLDRNHEQYMNNLRSDGSHSQFIDYIRDETNVTNNNSGQTYKVKSGSNYYWMNNDGQYIKTDNANWNPNSDPSYNNQNWDQATIND